MINSKKIELIAAAVAIAAFLAGELFLFPYSNILFVLSVATISMFYFAAGATIFGQLNKPADIAANTPASPPKAGIVTVFIGGVFAVVLIGILFKLQNWPFASQYLEFGMAGLLIAAVIITFNYTKTSYYNVAIAKRIVVYGIICIALLLLPKFALTDFKYRAHPAYLEALKNSVTHPGDTVLQNKLTIEREKLTKEN